MNRANQQNQRISESRIVADRTEIANSQFAIAIRQFVWFALSGLFLGLATHFYTASRFYPFFLGGFLILQAVIAYATGRRERAILRRNFWGIVVLFVVAALIFAPLGLYFVQHPGSFMQRASEVVATKAANPWLRMGQAAAANVLQFFVPGQGDPEQFYNLPRRAVFDPLTALLALIGIGVLLWRWRQPAALFLLTWFPALLLPSFLATDRWPTLPRVLGVIPAVYFYPAVGLLFVAGLLGRILSGRRGEGEGARGRTGVPRSSAPRSSAPLLLCALALLVHASATYRDYFRTWGPFAGDLRRVRGGHGRGRDLAAEQRAGGPRLPLVRHLPAPDLHAAGRAGDRANLFPASQSESELVRCAVGAAAAAARPARDLSARLRRAAKRPGCGNPGSRCAVREIECWPPTARPRSR